MGTNTATHMSDSEIDTAPPPRRATRATGEKGWNAKCYKLTYSHCLLDLQELADEIDRRYPIKRAVLCVELHAPNEEFIDEDNPTGEVPHIHIAVEFQNKVKIKKEDSRVLDFSGVHPNFKTEDFPDACKYCTKSFPDEPDNPQYVDILYYRCTKEEIDKLLYHAKHHPSEGNIDYVQHCLDAPTEKDWYNWAIKNKLGVVGAERLWKRFRESTVDDRTIDERPEFFPEEPPTPEAAAARTRLYEMDPARFTSPNKSIILFGPSRTGKTEYLKQLVPLPCLWVKVDEDLLLFRSHKHKSILFDDVHFWRRDIDQQLNMLERQNMQTIWARYKNARLPAWIPKFFTATEYIPHSDCQELNFRRELINLWEDQREPYHPQQKLHGY